MFGPQLPPSGTARPIQQRQALRYKEVKTLSSLEVLGAGLSYVGFDKARQESVNHECNVERFKAHYGIPPPAVAPMLLDLRADNPDLVYKKTLMAMNWLFVYNTYPVMAGTWGYSENFIGRQVIEYTRKIQKLHKKKLSSSSTQMLKFRSQLIL